MKMFKFFVYFFGLVYSFFSFTNCQFKKVKQQQFLSKENIDLNKNEQVQVNYNSPVKIQIIHTDLVEPKENNHQQEHINLSLRTSNQNNSTSNSVTTQQPSTSNEVSNNTNSTNNCTNFDPLCDACSNSTCTRCQLGSFIYNNKCYNVCPEYTIPNIYHRKCDNTTEQSKIIIFYFIIRHK